jgi:tryptophan synthase alpha chain
MSRIDRTFKGLKERGRSALIPFLMAGDPDLETTEALVLKMAECGADIIELGIPFSDPLADGPTIQAASQRALRNGTGLKDIFSLAERLKGLDLPLVLMTYFNPVLRFGLREFAEACHKSGVDGIILPDLPPEEAGAWIEEARRKDLDTIFLIAPTSPPERVQLASRFSRGFLYYVSLTGVTGTRQSVADGLEAAVRRIKKDVQTPVAVGFGISTSEQVKEVGSFADGVIVGSAVVKIIEENQKTPEMASRMGDFISSLSRALKGNEPSFSL